MAGNARRTLEASMSETASRMIAIEIKTAKGQEVFLLVICIAPTNPGMVIPDD